MRDGRNTILFTLLVVAALMIAACGPRVGASEVAESEDIVVSLPSLVIDYGEDGQANIGGMSLTEMSELLGTDLSDLNLGADVIGQLTQGNIQHIQVLNTANGLLILVNGQPIPSLAWDGESLASTATALELFGMSMGGLEQVLPQLLPLIQNLGLGVTVNVPTSGDADMIPLYVEGDETAAAAAAAARTQFLDAVGEAPKIRLTVAYDDRGVASVAGIDSESWKALSVPLDALNLDPSDLQQFRELGLDKVGVASNDKGLFISINDSTLPHISWASGEVNHVLNLAAQAGLLDDLLGGEDADPAMVLALIEQFLPMLQASELDISLDF